MVSERFIYESMMIHEGMAMVHNWTTNAPDASVISYDASKNQGSSAKSIQSNRSLAATQK